LVGVLAALPLILIALTGSALVFSDEMLSLGAAAPPTLDGALNHQEAALAFERTLTALEDTQLGDFPTLSTLRLPGAELGFARAWLADGTQALVDTETARVVSHFAWYENPATFLHELHVSLTLGPAGEQIVGGLGIIACGLLVSGLIALWRRRSTLRVPALWKPRSTRRGELTRAHGHWGLAVFPLVLLALLTGLGLTYHGAARALLTSVAGGESLARPVPQTSICASPERTLPRSALVDLATSRFPSAELVMVYPPREPEQPWGFRMRQPGEWHPNGRTMVWIDECTGALLASEDAIRAPLGERLVQLIYPLHSAGFPGALDDVLVLVTGVALAVVISMGTYARLR
jgi:uncharacterized iron-regulated membrane protein